VTTPSPRYLRPQPTDGAAPAAGSAGYLPELTLAASHLRAGERLRGAAGTGGPAAQLLASGGEQMPGPQRGRGEPGDRSGGWLRNAMAGLAVLAAAAAVVSYQAQYQLVAGYKHVPVVAAVQAAIPDVAALVFASLGIALALHGRRAVRARALNVASVGTSVAMNALAATPGWRALAVWVLPPTAYALASDTLIGVVRSWAIARQQQPRQSLAGEEATPLAMVGGLLLWWLRLVLAPVSTLAGFRTWVVTECPVAPRRRAVAARPAAAAITTGRRHARQRRGGPSVRPGSKTHRFLALVEERHGPVGQIPVGEVSPICTALAPEVSLNTGAARTALRTAVLAARNGGTS
jgi:hypothetical protein